MGHATERKTPRVSNSRNGRLATTRSNRPRRLTGLTGRAGRAEAAAAGAGIGYALSGGRLLAPREESAQRARAPRREDVRGFLAYDEAGRVVDFRLMVRPLRVTEALAARLGEKIRAATSRAEPSFS